MNIVPVIFQFAHKGFERAMEIYRKRWRIENFFNENGFLGLDRLPSLALNFIQTALTLKMVLFYLVDNFRKILSSGTKRESQDVYY